MNYGKTNLENHDEYKPDYSSFGLSYNIHFLRTSDRDQAPMNYYYK